MHINQLILKSPIGNEDVVGEKSDGEICLFF